jgi:TonB family protein
MKKLLHPLFCLLSGLALTTLGAQVAQKPGYTVVVEVTFDEQGEPDEGRIVESDDPTGEHILEQLAYRMVAHTKQPPRLVDGKPVKFKARAPFHFPVPDDEGAASDNAPKPTIHNAVRPAYPAGFAEKGITGGVILEIVVGADGAVKQNRTLRSSHPEFAQAVAEAFPQWTFSPARQADGTPVESRVRLAIVFATDMEGPEWIWRVAPRPQIGTYTVVRRVAPDTPPAAEAATPAPAPSGEKK